MGELEEQMKDFQRASQKECGELTSQMQAQHNDIQHYKEVISTLQQKQAELEITLTRERRLRQEAEMQVKSLQSNNSVNHKLVNLPEKRKFDAGQPVEQAPGNMDDLTCGKCDNDSRCQCIDDFIAAGVGMDQDTNSVFKTFDASGGSLSNGDQGGEATEIDFTTRFASQRTNNAINSSVRNIAQPSPRVVDPCGFCRNDTECICAAMAAEPSQYTPSISRENSSMKPPQHRQKSKTCTNNPGTCEQCQSDPTSTLFCKTLAASRATTQANTATNSSNGVIPSTSKDNKVTDRSGDVHLSCAEAYTTLSRHHAFPRASEQLGSWVSQLTPNPVSADTKDHTAFEIEAANVMSVLKFFDKKYGETPQKTGAR